MATFDYRFRPCGRCAASAVLPVDGALCGECVTTIDNGCPGLGIWIGTACAGLPVTLADVTAHADRCGTCSTVAGAR